MPQMIRMANLKDDAAFARFVSEHVAESGRDGSLHFSLSRSVVREEVRANAAMRWSRMLDESNWGRAFLLLEDDKRVVGHLELKGGRVPAEMHRASLGMGLLRAFTGKGWGRKLCEIAIAWARRDAKLAFIDLGVFRHNAPARRLYERMGFVEVGVRADAFRVDGAPVIDDVMMSLDLRNG